MGPGHRRERSVRIGPVCVKLVMDDPGSVRLLRTGCRLVGLFCAFVVASMAIAPSATVSAGAGASAFDGRWDVTLTCPPLLDEDDDAKGYVQHFQAEIKDGILRGTHGTEGQPSWHLLTGTVPPDGNAMLRLDGIVKNADYAVNHAERGKSYTYRVRAKFEQSSGSGQRVGKRKCEFRFKRR